MVKSSFYLLLLLTLLSCGNGDLLVEERFTYDQLDAVIFGHFYGECIGEECVEIFKWEIPYYFDAKLKEDTLDNYPSGGALYDGQYINIDTSILSGLSLDNVLDEEMVSYENTVIGCPDCADQGGLYFEIEQTVSGRTYWIIDQDKTVVPSEMHALMDWINETIQQINQ